MIETTVLLKFADGQSALRGLVNNGDENENVEILRMALGATEARVLGTVEGNLDTIVNDMDYAADGTKFGKRSRHLGESRMAFPLCDCGWGEYCPMYGTAL